MTSSDKFVLTGSDTLVCCIISFTRWLLVVSTQLFYCLQIPKPGGIKKGWLRQFAVICDFKLFLFDVTGDKPPQISQSATQVIDMR